MARKSKKIDFVNVNDLGQQTVTASVPVKSACYKVGLYARLSEETEANRERATIETQMELLRKFVAENDDMVIFKEEMSAYSLKITISSFLSLIHI